MGASCYDCGLEYGGSAWSDVVVLPDIWRKISPTGDEGGLLCFNCMCDRLSHLGLGGVAMQITSGPFSANTTNDKEQVMAEQSSSRPDMQDHCAVIIGPVRGGFAVARMWPASQVARFSTGERMETVRMWFVGCDGLTSIERDLAAAKERYETLEKERDEDIKELAEAREEQILLRSDVQRVAKAAAAALVVLEVEPDNLSVPETVQCINNLRSALKVKTCRKCKGSGSYPLTARACCPICKGQCVVPKDSHPVVSEAWLKKMADAEDKCESISAGGLASDLEMLDRERNPCAKCAGIGRHPLYEQMVCQICQGTGVNDPPREMEAIKMLNDEMDKR